MGIEIEYPGADEAGKGHADALRRHDAKLRAVLAATGQKFKWRRDLSVQREPYYMLVRVADGKEIFKGGLDYFKSQEPADVAREIASALSRIQA